MSPEYRDHQFPSTRQPGLIAQQLRAVLPDLVQEDRDGYLSVDYGRLTPLLVGAVKKVREECRQIGGMKNLELADLNDRIETLRAQNAELAARLARLEQLIAREQHPSGVGD